jgi:hypothetical protein
MGIRLVAFLDYSTLRSNISSTHFLPTYGFPPVACAQYEALYYQVYSRVTVRLDERDFVFE